MKILGIESSHDDTSIALIENQQVLFFHKISQIDIHKNDSDYETNSRV